MLSTTEQKAKAKQKTIRITDIRRTRVELSRKCLTRFADQKQQIFISLVIQSNELEEGSVTGIFGRGSGVMFRNWL